MRNCLNSAYLRTHYEMFPCYFYVQLLENMSTRPRRSGSKRNYRELADIKIPRKSSVVSRITKSTKVVPPSTDNLYRLNIIEKDDENGCVKVRYIGYGQEFDEWRLTEDIMELSESSSTDDSSVTATPLSVDRLCLYKELAYRIKALLCSPRKGNPACRVVMNFDVVYYEGLIRRATKQVGNGRRKREIYQLPSLTRLDDLLGERWYIRSVNINGDFCYIQPGSVKYYLKRCKKRIDYQMQVDGTLLKCTFGGQCQLVFQFICNDGILTQWNNVLKSCQ